MSGYYGDSHSLLNQHVLHEGLPEIPENQNIVEQPYSTNLQAFEGNQNLASENVARWFQQDAATEEHPPEAKTQSKARRRPPPGVEHVKHRRTRSGCYTCRQRRVKCDESHPTCERCRKGSRECTWPPEPTAKSATSKGGKQMSPDSGSSEDEEDYDDELTAKDDVAINSPVKSKPSLSSLKTASRKQSRLGLSSKRGMSGSESFEKDKSMSPSTTDDLFSPPGLTSGASTNTSVDDAAWSKIPATEQFYLRWHRQSLSYCHYFLKQDSCNFVRGTLIDACSTYKPLLNAVVGFAAFQYAVNHPGGKISTFLTYYNKGMSQLRKDLSSISKFTDAMIYTVLQLATFEEYMGDWANLMLHQKAACEMIKTLYTPETIMKSATSRVLFAWYVRMDLFVSFMSGTAPLIDIEWFVAYYQHTAELAKMHPDNFDFKIEALIAETRIHGLSITSVLAKLSKGEISIAGFHEENGRISLRVGDWARRVQALKPAHPERLVYDFGVHKPVDSENIVDPYQPGMIFDAESFSANFLLMDCVSVQVTHKMQTATALREPPSAELTGLVLEQCQIFEAIQEYQGVPNGSFLAAQVNIGLVCLFGPRDERHISWCRKMLARFENIGYMWPPTFRAKVADGWSMPSVRNSWLADDKQLPQIIKEIRAFIQERTTRAPTQTGEDVRSLRAILEQLNIEESPKHSPESSNSTTDAILSPTSADVPHETWADASQHSWQGQQHNQHHRG